MTLATDVKMLTELVNDLDSDVAELDENLDTNLIALALLEDARATLGHISRELTDKIAKTFPRDEKGHIQPVTVEGAGTWKASKKKDRTQWDRTQLLRDVLDTRQWDADGIDANPLDKVLKVWNLGAPRITALRELGLDADQYCHAEDAGWSIRLHTT